MQTELEGVEGIPSAHDPNRMFYPKFNGKYWVCDCEHYRIYRTPCRHILEKKFLNIQEILTQMLKEVKEERDIRDWECQEFDDVILLFELFRGDDMNKLATIMLNLAIYRGSVCTDDLHSVTSEHYAGNMVVGAVCGALLKSGLLKVIGRKATTRLCAHGRGINIYSLTEKGFKVLEARRPERALEVR